MQIDKVSGQKRLEAEEIMNSVHALNYGINLLDRLPISIRYLRKVHSVLLKRVRGSTKVPDELRNSQKWVGPMGWNLSNETYIPPSVDITQESLSNLEKYMNSDMDLPGLIKIALIHYQFEAIHPFLDGNGRIGCLIIPLWLKDSKMLQCSLLYLSLYFEKKRTEYYGLLMDVHFKGHYEQRIKFFLKGVISIAKNSCQTIKLISEMKKPNHS